MFIAADDHPPCNFRFCRGTPLSTAQDTPEQRKQEWAGFSLSDDSRRFSVAVSIDAVRMEEPEVEGMRNRGS